MKKTVCAAKVYESAEICNVLDCSVNNITRLNAGEQLFRCLCLTLCKDHAAVADDSASARIELGDDEFDLLSFILCKISLINIRYERCRDKYSCVFNSNCETALEDLSNYSCEDFTVVESFL